MNFMDLVELCLWLCNQAPCPLRVKGLLLKLESLVVKNNRMFRVQMLH